MNLIPVSGGQKINPAGRVYGRLTVTKLAGYIIETRNKEKGTTNRVAVYSCKCECGNELDVRSKDLKRGFTKSCGCLHKETSSQNGKNNILKGDDNASLNMLITHYKSRARVKKFEYNLSFEDFKNITSSNCYYCGIEPLQNAQTKTKGLAKAYYHNGIDRKDNTKGYTFNNVVPCCKTCNYAKRIQTEEEFLIWVKRISEYQNFCK
jgi:hypothetical protein